MLILRWCVKVPRVSVIGKLTCCVLQLIVDLVRQRVQENWSSQIILQLLSNVDAVFTRGLACHGVRKELSLDLSFQPPTINIILELYVLMEHLRDGGRIFL